MKVALYARTSTRDKGQNPEMQLEPLRRYCEVMGWGIYKEYTDKAKASDLVNRKLWNELLKDAASHKFDTMLIWKLDRAFRSVTHATNTLTVLNNYHVGFRSLMDTSIDTTTPNGILVFNILASVAQFEKDIDAQRIREGVKYAQEHGTKSGKPIGRERTPITDYQVQTTFDANNNNFSATARALTNNTGVEVSAGFVASRIKRMAAKEALQKSGVKIAVSDT